MITAKGWVPSGSGIPSRACVREKRGRLLEGHRCSRLEATR